MDRLTIGVIGMNGAIALGGFYLAWRVWHLGQTWATLADRLTAWEQTLNQALHPGQVPQQIWQRQQHIAQSRQRYADVQRLRAQLRQTWGLMTGLWLVGQTLRRRPALATKPLRSRRTPWQRKEKR